MSLSILFIVASFTIEDFCCFCFHNVQPYTIVVVDADIIEKKWCKSFFVEDVKLPFYTATKWLYVVVLSSPAFFHGIAILQNNVLQNAIVHIMMIVFFEEEK